MKTEQRIWTANLDSRNGSGLVRGLMKHLPERVAVTGGLAVDGAVGAARASRPADVLAPHRFRSASAELHNQTMTVTTFAEV